VKLDYWNGTHPVALIWLRMPFTCIKK
jgi:hypothetical protein